MINKNTIKKILSEVPVDSPSAQKLIHALLLYQFRSLINKFEVQIFDVMREIGTLVKCVYFSVISFSEKCLLPS
jgi:hypothetical protein